MSELRKDPVSQRWVIISLTREKSPQDYEYTKAEISGDISRCPFCRENKHMIEHTVYSDSDPEKSVVRIVNNKYPALIPSIDMERMADGIYDKMTGYGRHEVVIDSVGHDVPFHCISIDDMSEVLKALVIRHDELKLDKKLRYVLFFKNFGESAGASLSHSHMQLMATPAVPKVVAEELNCSRKYYEYKERCVFCDMIKQEMDEKERVIDFNDEFISIIPYAPRFPFECWILPRNHRSSFGSMPMHDIPALARILKTCLRRLQSVFPGLPYNFVIHTAPFSNSCKKFYHWHIEIMPRLTKIAGFEWGSGFYINETVPEKAAEYLREVREG